MGALIVVLASIIFGSEPSLQEHVMLSGASPLGMVIVCNTVAGLMALVIGLIKHESFKLKIRQLISLILTGAVGLFLTDYLLNLAYTMIPVGFTTMIHFLYPTVVCVICVFLFKDKFTKGKVGAIICSIAGLLLLTGGSFEGDKRGILVALVTAFAYAFYMIANDKLLDEVPLMARSFYMNMFVMLAAVGLNSVTHTAVFPHGTGPVLMCVVIGVLLSLAIALLNIGIGKLGAGKASFINMVEPVTSMVVSTIVYHYDLTVMTVVGCVLILISVLSVTVDGYKSQVRA